MSGRANKHNGQTGDAASPGLLECFRASPFWPAFGLGGALYLAGMANRLGSNPARFAALAMVAIAVLAMPFWLLRTRRALVDYRASRVCNNCGCPLGERSSPGVCPNCHAEVALQSSEYAVLDIHVQAIPQHGVLPTYHQRRIGLFIWYFGVVFLLVGASFFLVSLVPPLR
jgi:hypothetical protein